MYFVAGGGASKFCRDPAGVLACNLVQLPPAAARGTRPWIDACHLQTLQFRFDAAF